MSLDLSRISFNARRDFLGVLMQQGRVQLDADWNEWVTQLARRIQAGSLDTYGPTAVPRETTPDGFKIERVGSALRIHPGRIYVDGLLAENHGTDPEKWAVELAELVGQGKVDYLEQPYVPQPPALPTGDGTYLVYLDVWQRDVTHLQVPDLIEKAVGVDSTARLQTVWQVKVLDGVGDVTCSAPDKDLKGWLKEIRPSAGRLSTDTGDPPGEPDPCKLPPAAGYRGLENQLYRVEIHTGGTRSKATFKWSRDNATVASRVTHIKGNKVTVESVGRDDILRFHDGDWVEVTDDWHELHNEPGELRRIKVGGGVDDAARTIELEASLTAAEFPVNAQGEPEAIRNTRMIRWDQVGVVREEDGSQHVDLDPVGSSGQIPLPSSGTRLFLENGILVDFDLDSTGGEFKSGDHWVFAARSVDATIEELDKAPPRGIHHHYARLALVNSKGVTDCRTLWPPLVSAGTGCDCTVCVTADGHNAGKGTIQEAIDKIKSEGGTICLGIGEYRITKPLRVDEAVSLRIRGQGARTLLRGEDPGSLLEISDSSAIAVENLSLLGSAGGSRTTAAVSVSGTVVDLRLEHLTILAIAAGDATSVAVQLEGALIGCSISDCAMVAEQGIVRRPGERSPLLATEVRARDNILFCTQRAFGFDRLTVHVGTCSLSNNLLLGCARASIEATGAVLPGSSMTVRDNIIYTMGVGVAAGVDGLRIEDNEIAAFGSRSGHGIALVRGWDPVALDHVRIMNNRIRGMSMHGITIRQRVETGMIKQNTVTDVGGAGLIVEGAGSIGYLTVENNQFQEIGLRGGEEGAPLFAGIQVIAAERADISGNVISEVSRDTVRVPATGILLGAVGEARVAGNRLFGVGPDSSGDPIVAMHLLVPFVDATIDDNTVRRMGSAGGDPQTATWFALRVRAAGSAGAAGNEAAAATIGFAYMAMDEGAILLTNESAIVVPAGPSNLSVRGNRLRGRSTRAPLVQVAVPGDCLFMDNRCQVTDFEDNRQTGLVAHLAARVVNASNNRLVGAIKGDTLVVEGEKQAVVLGNISSGGITVAGAPLSSPWLELNLLHL